MYSDVQPGAQLLDATSACRHRKHKTVSPRACEQRGVGPKKTDWAREQGRRGKTKCRDIRAMLEAPSAGTDWGAGTVHKPDRQVAARGLTGTAK